MSSHCTIFSLHFPGYIETIFVNYIFMFVNLCGCIYNVYIYVCTMYMCVCVWYKNYKEKKKPSSFLIRMQQY